MWYEIRELVQIEDGGVNSAISFMQVSWKENRNSDLGEKKTQCLAFAFVLPWSEASSSTHFTGKKKIPAQKVQHFNNQGKPRHFHSRSSNFCNICVKDNFSQNVPMDGSVFFSTKNSYLPDFFFHFHK